MCIFILKCAVLCVVHLQAEGQGMNGDRLMRCYLPPDAQLPQSVRLGTANVRGTMQGSHTAPVVNLCYEAPESQLSGSAQFTQQSIHGSLHAPTAEANATVFTTFPHMQRLKNANTQVGTRLWVCLAGQQG